MTKNPVDEAKTRFAGLKELVATVSAETGATDEYIFVQVGLKRGVSKYSRDVDAAISEVMQGLQRSFKGNVFNVYLNESQ